MLTIMRRSTRPLPSPPTRLLTAGLLTFVSFVLTGCQTGGTVSTSGSSNAPSPGSSASTLQQATDTVDHAAYAALGYRLNWRGYALMGKRGRVRFFNVFDDGVVVHSDSNIVTLLQPSTGAIRWSRQIGQSIDHFVGETTHNGQLFVASDNELFMLDLNTGETQDKDDLALVVSTPPTVIDPLVIFGAGNGQTLAHNLETGFKLWAYQLQGAIIARPVRIGESVGVVSQTGDVIIIDTVSGSATLRARIFGGLASDPVAGDDAMYVASLDQSIYGFATQGDSWEWRVRTDHPLTEQPTLLNGVLYVGIPGEGLAALDPSASGDRIWTSPDAAGSVVGMQGGDLVVWSRKTTTAFRVDPDTGDVISRATLPDVERMQIRPAVDGDLYTASPTGVVSKFTPRS